MRKNVLFLILTGLLAGLPSLMQAQAASDYEIRVTLNGKALTNKLTGIEVILHPTLQYRQFVTPNNALLCWEDGGTDIVSLAALRIMGFSPTGIKEMKMYNSYSIKGDRLYVQGLEEKAQVMLYNLQGKLMATTTADAGEVEMNIGDLPKGVYLLKSGKVVIKFVKP